MARLGDICKLVSGNSLPEMIVAEKGELPYVKVAELNLPENIPNITTSRQFVSVTNISAKQIIPVRFWATPPEASNSAGQSAILIRWKS